MRRGKLTHLKLAVSIHSQPSFTTHRAAPSGALARKLALCVSGRGSVEFDVHGTVRSGSRYPLSLRNLST